MAPLPALLVVQVSIYRRDLHRDGRRARGRFVLTSPRVQPAEEAIEDLCRTMADLLDRMADLLDRMADLLDRVAAGLGSGSVWPAHDERGRLSELLGTDLVASSSSGGRCGAS